MKVIYSRASYHKTVSSLLKKANNDSNENELINFQVPSLPIQQESRNEHPEIGS